MTRLARWWKAQVAGGVAVEEVARDARTGEWHPDLHLMMDVEVSRGAVLQGKLTALWAAEAEEPAQERTDVEQQPVGVVGLVG